MGKRRSDRRSTRITGPHPLWAAPLAVAVTFLMVGCYTILKHPITSDGENAEQASHQEYYRGQCLDCHQDYATYPYGFFYGEYPDYYFEYPRWGHYYAYPWWWDRLWYENTNDGTGSDAGYVDSSGTGQDTRKASRRGGMVPPYVEGAAPINYGGGGYQYNGSSSGGGSGNQQGTGTTQPDIPGTRLRDKATDQTPPSKPAEAGETPVRLKEKTTQPASGTRETPKGSSGSGTATPEKPAGDSSSARPLEPTPKSKERRGPR